MRMDRRMLEMHRQKSMPCFCFSSQANGVLSCMLAGKELSGPLEKRYRTPDNLAILSKTKELTRQTGLYAEAIALAFITCQPFPCFALCGTADVNRVHSWGRIRRGMLDDKAVQLLNALTL